jgi:hypothetical protein
MNPPDPEPMMSLDKFMEQSGLSATTVWRWRKAGMLNTVNIYGRQYVLRSEIARFNERAAAGEFARRVPPVRNRAKLESLRSCQNEKSFPMI